MSRTKNARANALPLVLHVTEALGGGVTASILEYVGVADSYRHQLFASARPEHETGDDVEAKFERVTYAAAGPWGLGRELRRAVAQVEPDIIHLHSSWAGLLGRVLLSGRRDRLVYTPHCFYFERTDLKPAIRGAGRRIEQALATRCRVVAGCSPRETELARGLGARATHVPNVVPPLGLTYMRSDDPLIVAVGRLSAQKDPDFYLAVMAAAEKLGVRARWVWVGGGSADVERRLIASGVHVTGWQPREQCLSWLVQSWLYIHTASWEGSPMTLLEARALGVPTVVRSIPATVSLGYPDGLATPEQVAMAVRQVLAAPASAHQPEPAGREQQKAALLQCYDTILDEALGSRTC